MRKPDLYLCMQVVLDYEWSTLILFGKKGKARFYVRNVEIDIRMKFGVNDENNLYTKDFELNHKFGSSFLKLGHGPEAFLQKSIKKNILKVIAERSTLF